MGLFVCLEPADRHGGRQEPALQHGHGSGQLRVVRPNHLVGGHMQLGGWCPVAAGEGSLAGPAPFEEVGKVPG